MAGVFGPEDSHFCRLLVLLQHHRALRSYIMSQQHADQQMQEELHLLIGEGPSRFGPVRRMTTNVADEAIQLGLSDEEIHRFATILCEWQ